MLVFCLPVLVAANPWFHITYTWSDLFILELYLPFLLVLKGIILPETPLKFVKTCVWSISHDRMPVTIGYGKNPISQIFILKIDLIVLIIWDISILNMLRVVNSMPQVIWQMMLDSWLGTLYIMVVNGFVLEIQIVLWALQWHELYIY